jgi:hypothetical protein
LILDGIDSVPELEAILLLRDHRPRRWSEKEVGERLYVSTAVAGHLLNVLAERGFLSCVVGEYGFAPATPDLAETIDELAVTYEHHLIEVTLFIHSKPGPSIRQFANAFRLRRDK